jgi:hypothetical protein
MTLFRHDVAAEVVSPSNFLSTISIRLRPVLNDLLKTAVACWMRKLVDEGGYDIQVNASSN